MKRFKRAAAFVTSAFMLAGVLGGCSKKQGENIVMDGGNPTQAEDGILLTFFGYKADSENLVVIEQTLHSFMDANPSITVTYEGLKGMTYWENFEKRVSSNNMDDIVMIDHDHVLSLAAEHKLADLSDLSTVEDFESLAQSQFMEEDGSVYFLPMTITAYGLYINRDLLKKHGQEIPGNLEEFTRVCDYFASQGITPIIANNFYSLRSLMVAKGMYPVYQTDNYREEIERFNSGEADIVETLRPGIELVAMMIERGWFDCGEVLETAQTSDDLKLFARGDRPFMITGGWASVRVEAMDPGFEFGVYPYPILDDGCVLSMDVNTCISVRADSKNLEAAKKLVEYMTQPDVAWEYCNSQSSFTAMRDGKSPSDPAIEPCGEYIRNGQAVIGSDYNLALPLDTALMECENQMLKGMDADAAVKLLYSLLAPGKAAGESGRVCYGRTGRMRR